MAKKAQTKKSKKISFREAVHKALKRINGEYTGEELRMRLVKKGIKPKHVNAWGGVFSGLIGTTLIPTGEFRTAKAKESRSKALMVYRVQA